MKKPSLPPLAQLVKAYDSDPNVMAKNLYKLYAGNPAWGYRLSRNLIPAVYSKKIRPDQLKAACDAQKIGVARDMNWEVLGTVLTDPNVGKVTSEPYPAVFYPIRHDLKIRVRPDCYFIKEKQVFIVWLHPWRSFGLSHIQKALMATIIKRIAIDESDDFMSLSPPADLYLIDTSAAEGSSRKLRIYNFRDFDLLDEAELKSVLSKIAGAYDRFIKLVEAKPKKPKKKKQKTQDPNQLKLEL